MLILIGCSGFFSASEAALFSLRWPDRRAMKEGSPGQRIAARLLQEPERLLTAVLFWNLAINMAYFAIVSIVGLRLRESEGGGDTAAAVFAASALLAIIFFSEMLPKSLAVLSPRWFAGVAGLPVSATVRALDPLMPVLQLANLLSRRLIWPGFRPEPYLEVADLERMIEVSTDDEQLAEQERTALQNIVLLSDIRVEEWMRPRNQFVTFHPPVALSDLSGQMTPSGYLLISESDSDEVTKAINLNGLSDVPDTHLERLARPIVYVPWCNTVADAMQQMHGKSVDVAAVVNEFGDTIGILTADDVLDSVFTVEPTRTSRLLNRKAIEQVEPEVWRVTGWTSLRRIAKHFQLEMPPIKSVTLTGMIQESVQRLAGVGDTCHWGKFQIRVIEIPEGGPLLAEFRRLGVKEPKA